MVRRARPRPVRRPLALGLAALVAAGALQVLRPDPAAAAVTHLHGFRATVDGFTSWYGSYGMASLGTAWCIDHGIRAPDPAYRYAPADLSAVPASTLAAMAWAVASHGQGTDPVVHAALMLALHDLMGARYPSGRLDVDRLGVQRLAGFGGREAQVLATARAIKADGLAHQGLRGPLALHVEVSALDAAGEATVTAAVRDASGQGVGGMAIELSGAGLGGRNVTAPDGTVTARVRGAAEPGVVQASATVPHLPVDAWASTTTPAQRVARPSLDRLGASAPVPPASGQLVVRKTGDAAAWLPVTGARFRVDPATGGPALHTVEIGPDGTSPPVGLPVGSYQVVEEQPPPGYDAAGPWTVTVEHGRTAILEVADAAQRGALQIHKVDAESSAPLAGATLELRYDSDADGAFELVVAQLTTDGEPSLLEGLLPGRYSLSELAAPTGYELRTDPLVIEVAPGAMAEAVLANAPLPPPATVPPTTVPPTTVPPTTVPPTTAAAPPVTVLSAVPVQAASAAPALARTGADTLTLVLLATGLVLVGGSLVQVAPPPARTRRRQPSAPSARRAAMRSAS